MEPDVTFGWGRREAGRCRDGPTRQSQSAACIAFDTSPPECFDQAFGAVAVGIVVVILEDLLDHPEMALDLWRRREVDSGLEPLCLAPSHPAIGGFEVFGRLEALRAEELVDLPDRVETPAAYRIDERIAHR